MGDPVYLWRDLFRAHPGAAVHLVGIGGVGMAGLAGLLRDRGYQVDGCEHTFNRLTARLQQQGIQVWQGQDSAHLRDEHVVCIRSTAVPLTHPECAAAIQRGIAVLRRGEVFPALLLDEKVVAVSGTHGKTTTTALCAHAIRAAADAAPAFFIGGEWEGDGRVFERGPYPVMVVEADESDGTLINYHPQIAVLTGIDFDHMEHFQDEPSFVRVFEKFLRQAREAIVYCADDSRLGRILPDATRCHSYGFHEQAFMRASEVAVEGRKTTFTVSRDGRPVGRYTLSVPGRHNVQNAMAALTVVDALGLPLEKAGESLKTFQPVRRRFERVGDWQGIPVYTDYAHHPTEIKALIASLPQTEVRRWRAIFQPHRYTRTRA